MADVFISHSEHDSRQALELALTLEECGISTWCYELDSILGASYLLQTRSAITESRAVVLFISRASTRSVQVTKEVVRAHESGKAFIPLLVDLIHREFIDLQPEWHEALGAASSVRVPPSGIAALLPDVILGLAALGVRQANPDDSRIARIKSRISDEMLPTSAGRESASHPGGTPAKRNRVEPASEARPMGGSGSRATSSHIRLVVHIGATEESHSFQAPGQRLIFIGRNSPHANLLVASRLVSRLHAVIAHGDSGEWTLTDLATTNGTSLNGRRVEQAALRDGDEITIGDVRIQVRLH
jgi:hypothetical protein